jgi:hypothetical protein
MTKEQILKQQQKSADASPAKSLVSDLTQLRHSLRATGQAYLRNLEAEIDEIASWAKTQTMAKEPRKSQIRDLGDMITLVRKLEIKPQKGRRKDLKKIDTTVSELREFLGEN